jgi:hypothetical protein
MLTILPPIAYALCVMFILWAAVTKDVNRLSWIVPSILGIAFFGVTMQVLLAEGLMQFWFNHVANLAGNQVWFDLLIAVSISFYLIVPRARAVGMKPLPWGIAVFATASVALLPMVARLLWLEKRR